MEKPIVLLRLKVCSLTLIYFFGNEQIAIIVCLEISLTENFYHIVDRQFTCIANQLSSFYIIQVLTTRYFQADYSYLQTMSIIAILKIGRFCLRSRFKQCGLFI